DTPAGSQKRTVRAESDCIDVPVGTTTVNPCLPAFQVPDGHSAYRVSGCEHPVGLGITAFLDRTTADVATECQALNLGFYISLQVDPFELRQGPYDYSTFLVARG